MSITLAKTAGFCFGVNKAVTAVSDLLDCGETVCTLGPIIHNPQVVERLAARGVTIVESPAQVPDGAMMVIRSHGVPQSVYEEAAIYGVKVCDATCPFVAKIHRLVKEYTEKGATAFIAGDPTHPEVIGIRGHAVGPSYVFSTEEELESLIEDFKIRGDSPENAILMVAQTTFHLKIWKNCVKFAKKHYTNLFLFDTICNATADRQQEAAQLSKESDLMVIVGGRQSSNTAKLRDVCAAHCRTVLVETAAELTSDCFVGATRIGVTAGASTPDDMIKEVLSTMTDIINNENPVTEAENAVVEAPAVEEAAPVAEAPAEVAEEEVAEAPAEQPTEETAAAPVEVTDDMTFKEMLDVSLPEYSSADHVRGIVVAIAPNEVQVEVIGRKQTGYIPADELSADPTVSPADIVKVGDELELLIMRTNDQEGTIMLSKKRIDSAKGWETIVEAGKSNAILEGVVTDIIKGGMLVSSHGVRVFIPASQASASRMDDLSPLLKTTVQFRVIETNQSRRRAVGSVRAVAREVRKEKEAAFWAQAAVGQTYTGVVKSLTSYGAFVDLGGVDGMVHISELSWNRIKHPSDVVKVGDTVSVYIRDLDPEKKKISLGYRKAEDNPWEIFRAKFAVGDVTTAKIVGMTTFGAFAQILPGVDGLIHISQIANHRVEKPQDELSVGQEVTVKITNVNYDAKRISLSIRALLEPEAPAEEAPVEEAPAEEAPVEEVPVEEAPFEEAPAEEAPAEEAPVEEAPAAE
ncbi:MAG: bifunctional 4-hydroxy-3-methylbut-2-enyl diphosphate reductase/30S ribosomal protein S1 [Clostridia bacterium]|nr:bifunctional 4-hydroxy-3-methylbut-2-enyl diphosphate reductase/30S ribosomal protein S1 [Clostridia bacterium]